MWDSAWRWASCWVPVLPAVSESGTAWPSAPEPLWAPAVASVWECQQGAWIATGCAPVVGSGVAAGAAVAVGVAATVVATAGDVCSPPQPAKAITVDRHSSSTVEAIPVPVGLPHTRSPARPLGEHLAFARDIAIGYCKGRETRKGQPRSCRATLHPRRDSACRCPDRV